ncbi:MAG: IS21-like element helper ATPase IstB [Spirochaetaceae bacterium]|nr:IS21-like element helper ATPase IstB [Spirochaetaceae bacterium]
MGNRQHLETNLKRLKMPGLARALDTRVSEARENDLGHLEFLSLLIDDEMNSRENSMLGKRLKAAGFGVQKTFEQFDFKFNEEALSAKTLRDLATCSFIEQQRNLVIGGPPGIGKTHAVKAIGHQACRAGYQVLFRSTQRLLSDLCADSIERAQRELARAIKVDLLILDDFAFRILNQKEAEMLYVLADARLGTASTVLTSNRPPDDWYAIFPDPVVGGAILDRMVSAAIKIITTKGRSYRREVMGKEKCAKKASSATI